MMRRDYGDLLKLKVCLVGDATVGKTSMIRKYVYNEFSDKYLTTLGTKITKKKMTIASPEGNGEISVDMAVWDIMGQHGFRALLQEAYFFGVDGIIAVCDLTRKETLDGLNDWMSRVRRTVGDVPVVIAGNKKDLEEERVICEEDLNRVAEMFNGRCFTTSAKTGENIESVFEDLTKEIVDRIEEKRQNRGTFESPSGFDSIEQLT